MQIRKIDQRHLWLLSGTGEGPVLAKALIERGFLVSVSVVSYEASLPYKGLPLEALWIGPIEGVEGVRKILQEAECLHGGFDWVLDATHPFALLISSYLTTTCSEMGQALLRFERTLEHPSWVTYINCVEDIPREELIRKNFLLAIGSKDLRKSTASVVAGGANVFARVLDTPESLRKALSSSMKQHHLAVLRPFTSKPSGEVEKALCRKWSIDSVICRQSGGVTQRLWQEISIELHLNLYLISRPVKAPVLEVVSSFETLLERVSFL